MMQTEPFPLSESTNNVVTASGIVSIRPCSCYTFFVVQKQTLQGLATHDIRDAVKHAKTSFIVRAATLMTL